MNIKAALFMTIKTRSNANALQQVNGQANYASPIQWTIAQQ